MALQDFPDLHKQFDVLQNEKAEIIKIAAPFHKEYNELAAKITPIKDKMRELANKFRSIEQPRLGELDKQIAAIARATGAKSVR